MHNTLNKTKYRFKFNLDSETVVLVKPDNQPIQFVPNIEVLDGFELEVLVELLQLVEETS